MGAGKEEQPQVVFNINFFTSKPKQEAQLLLNRMDMRRSDYPLRILIKKTGSRRGDLPLEAISVPEHAALSEVLVCHRKSIVQGILDIKEHILSIWYITSSDNSGCLIKYYTFQL